MNSPTKHLIVGFTGRKQSGKDTAAFMVANFLRSILPAYARVAFADAIKQEIADAFGIDLTQLETRKTQEPVRKILQWWGTEQGRLTRGEDVWIRQAAQKISTFEKSHFIYIPDVRFPNEAAWIKELGGKLVRIFNPNTDNLEDNHSSESYVDKISYDYSIRNDSNLRRLELGDCVYVAEELQKYYERTK